MDDSYFSALFGLAGAAVGGATTLATAWLTQRTATQNTRLETLRARREALFGDFISEATRLYGDALSHQKDDVGDLVFLYAIVAKMRLLATPRTVLAAEGVMDRIIETYLGANRSLHELKDLAKSGGMNFLLDFAEAARDELAELRTHR